MKYLLAAMGIVIAAPAAAQTAPADPHQGHAAPQAQGQPAAHSQHQPGQHGQHQAGQQGQHQGQDMASGCCADRNGNGVMDCCENMAQGRGEDCCAEHGGQRPAQAQPSGHSNH
jgi:hypothetical protein